MTDWENAKVIDRESDEAGRYIREAIWIWKREHELRRGELPTYGTSFYILTTGAGSQS